MDTDYEKSVIYKEMLLKAEIKSEQVKSAELHRSYRDVKAELDARQKALCGERVQLKTIKESDLGSRNRLRQFQAQLARFRCSKEVSEAVKVKADELASKLKNCKGRIGVLSTKKDITQKLIAQIKAIKIERREEGQLEELISNLAILGKAKPVKKVPANVSKVQFLESYISKDSRVRDEDMGVDKPEESEDEKLEVADSSCRMHDSQTQLPLESAINHEHQDQQTNPDARQHSSNGGQSNSNTQDTSNTAHACNAREAGVSWKEFQEKVEKLKAWDTQSGSSLQFDYKTPSGASLCFRLSNRHDKQKCIEVEVQHLGKTQSARLIVEKKRMLEVLGNAGFKVKFVTAGGR